MAGVIVIAIDGSDPAETAFDCKTLFDFIILLILKVYTIKLKIKPLRL